MAIISNGTTIASGGSLSVAPTNSQILSGVASASTNSVGSYSMLYNTNQNTEYQIGQTRAHNGSSSYKFSACGSFGPSSTYPAGTWRCMGAADDKNTNSLNNRATIWLRIS